MVQYLVKLICLVSHPLIYLITLDQTRIWTEGASKWSDHVTYLQTSDHKLWPLLPEMTAAEPPALPQEAACLSSVIQPPPHFTRPAVCQTEIYLPRVRRWSNVRPHHDRWASKALALKLTPLVRLGWWCLDVSGHHTPAFQLSLLQPQRQCGACGFSFRSLEIPVPFSH